MAKGGNLKFLFSADTKDLKQGAKEARQAIGDFEKTSSGILNQFTGLFGASMGQIATGLNTFKGGLLIVDKSLKSATEGAGRFSKALNVLKVALASTGIGLIAVALGSLVAYFTKSKDGAEKLERAMAPLKAIFSVLGDLAASVGRAIVYAFESPKEAIADLWNFIKSQFVNRFNGLIDMVSNFALGLKNAFTLNFSEAGENFKATGSAIKQILTGLDEEQREAAVRSLKDRVNGIKDVAAAAASLKRQEQELADARRDWRIEEKELENEISDLRLKAKQEEEYTAEQRKKFFDEAIAKTNQLYSRRTYFANEELRILKEIGDLDEDTAEDLDKLVDKRVEVLSLVKSQNDELRTMQKEQLKLNKLVAGELEERERIAALRALPQIGEVTAKLDIELPQVDFMGGEAKKRLDASVEAYRVRINTVKDDTIDMTQAVSGLLGGMTDSFATGLGDLIATGASFGGFAKLVASTFADMAISVGKIAIQTGMATIGIKAALKSLNPAVAIAAGAALVALGTAAKGALNSVASGSANIPQGIQAGSTLNLATSTVGAGNYETSTVNVKISGEFRAKGNELVAVIDNEGNRRRLTT